MDIKNVEKPKKWWQKELSSTLSFFFVILALVVVFTIGTVFMRAYLKIWAEISQKEQESFFIEDLQKINREKTGDVRLKDIIQP